jgi:hypothetical protein
MNDETKSDKTSPDRWPQLQHRHPREWEGDLNPDHGAGQNLGAAASEGERDVRTAYDYKEVHALLNEFRDDELRKIPILPEGQRLRQGGTYLDLGETHPHAFTAMGGDSAGPNNYYVAKTEVPYTLWNRLTGKEKPGQEHEGEKEAA